MLLEYLETLIQIKVKGAESVLPDRIACPTIPPIPKAAAETAIRQLSHKIHK